MILLVFAKISDLFHNFIHIRNNKMDVDQSESEITIGSPLLQDDSIESDRNDETYLDRLGRVIVECCKIMVNEMHGASLNVQDVQDLQILQMEDYTKGIHETRRKGVRFLEYMKDMRYDEEYKD